MNQDVTENANNDVMWKQESLKSRCLKNKFLMKYLFNLVKASLLKVLEENYALKDGREVSIGSEEHILELERILSDLTQIRNLQPKRFASRYAYSRAVERLRNQIATLRRIQDREKRRKDGRSRRSS